jgi:DNA-binding FrmR family transcriptional regulator
MSAGGDMSHTIKEKNKLLNRVRRIRGQIEALERALEQEKGCSDVLHLAVAARGALNSLVAEVIEDHIRVHVVDPARERNSARSRGAEELIDIVQAFLK